MLLETEAKSPSSDNYYSILLSLNVLEVALKNKCCSIHSLHHDIQFLKVKFCVMELHFYVT